MCFELTGNSVLDAESCSQGATFRFPETGSTSYILDPSMQTCEPRCTQFPARWQKLETELSRISNMTVRCQLKMVLVCASDAI